MAARRLALLGVIAVLCCGLYMTVGAKGSWSFLIPFRGAKLGALVLVAVAISTATVMFQTITQNRILTPSIMGFDALYVLIVTAGVFFFGGGAVARLPDQVSFAINAGCLILAALALFGTLLGQGRSDLLRMILTGIIFGVLFRSLTSFMQRIIDPNEFAVVQVSSYARFTQIETDLLAISAVATAGALAAAWRMRHRLDVLGLGQDAAINLGENPARGRIEALVIVAVLVSVSTALVGPVSFFGLLVVSLAHLLVPAAFHAVLLPASALIAVIVLVGGQTLLERVLGLVTPLSVIVDLLGGAVFLFVLLRGVKR